MEKFEILLSQLQSSISSLKIDFQLLQMLKQQVKDIPLDGHNFQDYIRSLILVYELSNNEKLYTIKRTSISINEMAVQLKVLVCKMMSDVISYFQKDQSVTILPIQVLTEAIQIMILSARVCLNQASKYTSEIEQFYRFIHSPFEYVMESLRRNLQFLHHLNVLELMRYKCENQTFNIIEFEKRLQTIVTFQEIEIYDYRNFIENVVMQTVLKSLKNGRLLSENAKKFFGYLSESNQRDLQVLTCANFESIKNLERVQDFLQIYLQIKEQGIQTVSRQFLEEFIQKEKNFNDERIFEVAALTFQPVVLDIWFNILNKKKQKYPYMQRALHCFIHIAEGILNKNIQTSQNMVQNLISLSKNVILNLLTQKKTAGTNQPVLTTIKTMIRVLTWICFSLFQNSTELKDFGQKIDLLASRYQCLELNKVVYAILLYYCLVKKVDCEDIHQKFVIHHNSSGEKSTKIYTILSAAYDFRKQKGNKKERPLDSRLDEISKFELKKQPFIAILFAEQGQDLTIFDMEMKDFKQTNRKFYIYAQTLKKYKCDLRGLQKILNHMEGFIIKLKFDEFQTYLSTQQSQSIKQIQEILLEFLEKRQKRGPKQKISQNSQISRAPDFRLPEVGSVSSDQESKSSVQASQLCFILINLYILSKEEVATLLKETNFGVLLNKFSIKVKIVNSMIEMVQKGKLQLSTQFYKIICCYVMSIAEKFKKQSIKKQRIGQPGQVSFVHTIVDIIFSYNRARQSKSRIFTTNQDNRIDIQQLQQNTSCSIQSQTQRVYREYVYFTIFQIDCMTNNHEKYIKKIQQLPISLLKAYNQSIFIPKNLKQKLLRRIVRQNFMYHTCQITLKQFKEIIQITESEEEIELYIKCVFSAFKQQGKNMIMLMAHNDKRLQKILLKDNQVEI